MDRFFGYQSGAGRAFNLLMPAAAKSSLTVLIKSCKQEGSWESNWKEKCYSGHYQQLFKYFAKLFPFPKILAKVLKIKTTISGETLAWFPG